MLAGTCTSSSSTTRDSQITDATITIDKTSLGITGTTEWTDVTPVELGYTGGDKTGVDTQFMITVPARRSAVFSVAASSAVTYTTRVEFDTDDAAPLENPYNGEDGTIIPVETSGSLTVAGGKLTTGTNSGWTLGFYGGQGVARAAGRMAEVVITPSHKNFNAHLGWSVNQSVLHTNHDAVGFGFANPSNLSARAAGATLGKIAELVGGSTYRCLDVLRSTGNKLYLKKDLEPYKLAWTYGFGSTGTVYPWFTQNSATGVCDIDRVAVPSSVTFVQDPIVADGFTGANGTNIDERSSDATSPAEETGGSGVQADFLLGSAEIQSNNCQFTNASESLLVYQASKSNVHMLARFDPSDTGPGNPFLVVRLSDVNNYWKHSWNQGSSQIEIIKVVAGTPTTVATASLSAGTSGEAYDIRSVLDGTIHKVYVNNTNLLEYDSAGSEFNTSATKHGAGGSTNGDVLEYIEIWDLEPTIPTF